MVSLGRPALSRARAVAFVAGSTAGAIGVAYLLQHPYTDPQAWKLTWIALAVGCALWLGLAVAALSGSSRALGQWLLIVVSTAGSLGLAEGAVRAILPITTERPWWHVELMRRRAEGQAAYPFLGHANHRDLKTGMTCLSGLGNVITVGFPGAPEIADRHGFNNPPGYYEAHERFPLFAVGDSFVHGGQIVQLLRDRLGVPVYNAGYNSNGPVRELATIIEYAAAKQPPVVLWFLFEGNDVVIDLGPELQQPDLNRYLDDPTPRGLVQEADARNRILRPRLDQHLAELKNGWPTEDKGELMRWIRLPPPAYPQLAQRLAQISFAPIWGSRPQDVPPKTIADFRRVMRTAKQVVQRWDGQLVVIYLPCYSRLLHPHRFQDAVRQATLRALQDEQIRTVDLTPTFVANRRRAARAWFFGDALEPGESKHYNETGSAVVAEAVIRALHSDLPRRFPTVARGTP